MGQWEDYDVYDDYDYNGTFRPLRKNYYANERVKTPIGDGSIWLIDEDGIICVQLDGEPDVLYEFRAEEINKISIDPFKDVTKSTVGCLGGSCPICDHIESKK